MVKNGGSGEVWTPPEAIKVSGKISNQEYQRTMEGKMILYTTHCPKCAILEKKLVCKGVGYETCDDAEKMRSLGITSVPVLELPDGTRMDYFTAVKYVNAM